MRTSRGTLILYMAAIVTGAVSALCFMVQGGFGGGHGDWDIVIGVLSLPWALISWPDFVENSDFVSLTLLPFLMNMLSITLVRGVLTRSGRSRPVAGA